MKLHRLLIPIVVLLLLTLGVAQRPAPLYAQADQSCPQLVQAALDELGTNCARLDRNAACYGFNRVNATFSRTMPPDTFSATGDRADLATLRSIETANLDPASQTWGIAVLSVQADLPTALPGQAAVFLLLGDVTLENAVDPADTLLPAAPVTVTTAEGTTLRSRPGMQANAVGVAPAGTTFQADRTTEDGYWVRVLYQTGPAWINIQALEEADLSGLPVDHQERFTPMQAFTFSTGFGAPACDAAPPSTLVVQSPERYSIDIRANGVDIRLGSTIFLRTLPNNAMEIIVGAGQATLYPGTLFELVIPPGVAVTVPLGPDGQLLLPGLWGTWRLLSQAELDQFAGLENVPPNIFNTPFRTPIILSASGVGHPVPGVQTPGGVVFPTPPSHGHFFIQIPMDPTAGGEPLPRAPWRAIRLGQPSGGQWILYHSNPGDGWGIYRLSDPREAGLPGGLVIGPGSSVLQPALSPDRNWIAYTSDHDPAGGWEIYVTRSDGSQPQRVTYNTGTDINPAWGPDGRIVYESTRDGNWELYLFDVSDASGEEIRLTDSPGNDINAYWMPDGSAVIFQSDRDGDWELYRLDMATLEVTQITNNATDDLEPVISHNGEMMVWAHTNTFGTRDLWLMDLESGDTRILTDTGTDIGGHVFAPDDSYVVYHTNLDGDYDIYAVDIATGIIKALTVNTVTDRAPAFWPDGRLVIYQSTQGAPANAPDQFSLYGVTPLPLTGPASAPLRMTFDAAADDMYPLGESRSEFNSREGLVPPRYVAAPAAG